MSVVDVSGNHGSILHDISYYKDLVSRNPLKIHYPEDVVIFSGQLSHFITRSDGKIDSFTLRVNKFGLNVGDATLTCEVDGMDTFYLSPELLCSQGIVIGLLKNHSGLGEPKLSVKEMIIDNKSSKPSVSMVDIN